MRPPLVKGGRLRLARSVGARQASARGRDEDEIGLKKRIMPLVKGI